MKVEMRRGRCCELGDGEYWIGAIEAENNMKGIMIRPAGKAYEIDSSDPKFESNMSEVTEDDMIIFCKNLESARVLQDAVNIMVLELNGRKVTDVKPIYGKSIAIKMIEEATPILRYKLHLTQFNVDDFDKAIDLSKEEAEHVEKMICLLCDNDFALSKSNPAKGIIIYAQRNCFDKVELDLLKRTIDISTSGSNNILNGNYYNVDELKIALQAMGHYK